jgi:hypothetical protein
VSRALARGAAAAALLAAFSASAAAQGKGRGLGQTKNHGSSPHDAPAEDPTIPGTGLRQFGVWLDDATISPAGRGWGTFGVGYSRAPFARQWDLPSVDAGIGMSPRTQVAVTAPVSRIRYDDGSALHGLGDVYLAVKVGVLDPTAAGRTFGVAVVPVLEFLSSGSVPEGEGRVSWALPIAFEKRCTRFRTYGTVGYFSRGAAFASGAVEVPVSAKVTATGVLSHSRSLLDIPVSDASGLATTRWDAGLGAVYFLSGNATLYASLGRTVSRIDANASSLSVGAGVSLGFQRPVRGR